MKPLFRDGLLIETQLHLQRQRVGKGFELTVEHGIQLRE
jgi:hypothetical protein